MTTFKALFNQMGKKKRRSVYLLALLQLVASTFALWGLFIMVDLQIQINRLRGLSWYVLLLHSLIWPM